MEMDTRHGFMKKYRRSYAVYSIGCAIVWVILLSILTASESTQRMHQILAVFGGFVIGWTSATIARFVYPPPSKWRHDDVNGDGPAV